MRYSTLFIMTLSSIIGNMSLSAGGAFSRLTRKTRVASEPTESVRPERPQSQRRRNAVAPAAAPSPTRELRCSVCSKTTNLCTTKETCICTACLEKEPPKRNNWTLARSDATVVDIENVNESDTTVESQDAQFNRSTPDRP